MKEITITTATQLAAKNNVITYARELRAEGHHEEADRIILDYEGELARDAENLSRRTHMAKRKSELQEIAEVDPEHDTELFESCSPDDPSGYYRVAIEYAEQDNGPAEKGMAGPQYLYFLRNIEKLPPVDAAKKFEKKVDGRLNRVHHFLARAGNRWTWDLLVAKYGIDKARSMKADANWIKVRRHDHFEENAEPGATVESSDLTDNVNGANADDDGVPATPPEADAEVAHHRIWQST